MDEKVNYDSSSEEIKKEGPLLKKPTPKRDLEEVVEILS